MKFDEQLLSPFMDTYFGYGNLKSDFWYVGMEEGGDTSEDRIHEMLNHWRENGQYQTKTLKHGRSTLQKTWEKLIKIHLSSKQEGNPSIEEVRQYHQDQLGQESDCLVELFPLPSPGMKKWSYKNWKLNEINFLDSRKNYRQKLGPTRVETLKQLIAEHRPKVVLFYGKQYQSYWNQITSVQTEEWKLFDQLKFPVMIHQTAFTLYVSIAHVGGARGVTNQFLYDVGKLIKEHRP